MKVIVYVEGPSDKEGLKALLALLIKRKAEQGVAVEFFEAPHLGTRSFKTAWTRAVEDQNDDTPPKRIVEKLFAESQQKYRAPADAPAILRGCDYHEIADRCSQCFKPFVEFLEGVSAPAVESGA